MPYWQYFSHVTAGTEIVVYTEFVVYIVLPMTYNVPWQIKHITLQ